MGYSKQKTKLANNNTHNKNDLELVISSTAVPNPRSCLNPLLKLLVLKLLVLKFLMPRKLYLMVHSYPASRVK